MALLFLDSAQGVEFIKNNPCDSTNRISPDSWCKKSESKGAVVPPADFLLESELRGTPPKSEKAAAFWRVGGAGRGVQPFLREKTSDSISKQITNDLRISKIDSSLTAFAQNDDKLDFFGDSTNRTHNGNNGEFIISYRAIMKNNILIGEEFKVAKALTTSQNPTIIAQCDIIEFSPNDSHIKTLKQNQSAILECIERELKSKIRDDVKSINNEVRTKTTYKIPAQRILLDRQRLKIHIIGQK